MCTRLVRSVLLRLLLAAPICVLADDTLRIVVPYGPGPGLDAVARILAKQLSVVRGTPVIVDNRPGAGTVIGTEFVHHAKPDGKTVLLNGSALALGAANNSFTFNPMTGLSPIIQVSDADSFLVIHAGLPVKSLSELIALSTSRGLNCGAVAGQYEIACRYLHSLLGENHVTVVYKGVGEATTALYSGEVDLMFASKSMLTPMLPSGKVRLLAAATPGVADAPFADLPLLKKKWPDFVLSGLVALYAGSDTPPELVQNLNRQLNQVLSDPEVKQSLKSLGLTPVGGPPSQVTQRLIQDIRFFSTKAVNAGIAKP